MEVTYYPGQQRTVLMKHNPYEAKARRLDRIERAVEEERYAELFWLYSTDPMVRALIDMGERLKQQTTDP